jgi:hypothetical protein
MGYGGTILIPGPHTGQINMIVITKYKSDTDKPKRRPLSAWPTGRNLGDDDFLNRNPGVIKFRSQKMSVRGPNGECLPFNRELRMRKLTTAPRGGRNWKGITGWTENRDKRKGVPQYRHRLRTIRSQGRIKGFVSPTHFSSLGPFGDSISIVGTMVYSRLSG